MPTPTNNQPLLATTAPLDQAVEHLTIPRRNALTAIIEGRPVTAAAKEAGVHRATVHRWLKSNPVFRAAYNAWEHESKTNTMARLLAIVKKALDAVTWSIDKTLQKNLLGPRRGVSGPQTRRDDEATQPYRVVEEEQRSMRPRDPASLRVGPEKALLLRYRSSTTRTA